MGPCLRVVRGPDSGAIHPLHPGENTIGRDGSNDVVLSDEKVSAHHARIAVRDDGCTIRDLGSTNGTFLGHAPVSRPTALTPGALIHLGKTTLVFEDDTSCGQPPSPVVELVPGGEAEPPFPMAWSPEETTVVLPPTARGIKAEELRRLYGILSALYRVTSVVGRAGSIEELFGSVLEVIFDILPADRGSVLLAGEGKPRPVAARSRRPQDGPLQVSATVVRTVLASGRGLLVSDAADDERLRSGDSVVRYGIRSVLCVPVRTERELFGVIYLDTLSPGRRFEEADLELLRAVGNEVGLAVENFRLRQENLQAERLAAVGKAMAGISHYVRNILQGVEGARDLVPQAIKERNIEEIAELWQDLDSRLELLSELVLNMLSYSRTAPLERISFCPNTATRQVVEVLSPRAQRLGGTIRLSLDPEVQPLLLDKAALQRALVNIVNNAIEAAPGGQVDVATRWDVEGRRFVVTVSDQGPGIPAELREKAFEPFFTTKGARGTGLGLAVSRKLVEEMGGHIWIESAPGTGTTVAIALPAEAT